MVGHQVDAPLDLVAAKPSELSQWVGGLYLAIIVFVLLVIFTAWFAAKRFLSPRDIFGISDERIRRQAFFRSFAGLLTIVVVTLPFRSTGLVMGDNIAHIIETLAVGAISVLICTIFMVTIASCRGALITRIWRPLLKMALTFGPLYAGYALGHISAVTRLLNMKHPTLSAVFVQSNVGWLIIVIFCLFTFALFAFYYSARFLYCPGEVHPLLSPLVAIVAVTLLMAREIALANRWFGGFETFFEKVVGHPTASSLQHPVPQSLVLALTLGGWLSTTGLAVLEWHSLKHNGISLREAPEQVKELERRQRTGRKPSVTDGLDRHRLACGHRRP